MTGKISLTLVFVFFSIFIASNVNAQVATHPLSGITPIDTNLGLNNKNITDLSYLLYSGGIFYAGSQGIPTADIANSAVTGAKIASSAITASKISNPLGGSLNASAYYDSDNSNYYVDPAAVGVSASVAGNVNANSINTSRFIYSTLASSTLVLHPAPNSYTAVTAGNGATLVTMGAGEGSAIATYMPTGTTYPFTIYSSTDTSSPILRVLSSGKLGIGNVAPVSALDVTGAGNFTANTGTAGLTVTTTNPGANAALISNVGSGDGTNSRGLYISHRTQNANANLAAGLYVVADKAGTGTITNMSSIYVASGGVVAGTVTNNYGIFVEGPTGGTNNYAAVFANGNVGVGTTNPQRKLEVVGDLNVTGTIYGALNTTGDVNCTGCVDTSDIANSAVTTAKIANSAVTSGKLSNPLGGSVNATAYYDSDNSNYFLDPASSGTSLTTAGSVGINTTSPSLPLHLTFPESRIRLQSVNGRTYDLVSGGGGALFASSFGIQDSSAGGAPFRFVIDSTGQVGIGTTSPSNKLHVVGGNGLTVSGGQPLEFISGGSLPVIKWYGTANLIFGNDGNTANIGNGAAGNQLVAITPGGNVGIGTTAPSTKLHLVSTNPALTIENSTSGGDFAGLDLKSGGTQWRIEAQGTTGKLFVTQVGVGGRLTIDSTGAVGINTTTPAATLQISGHVGDRAILISNNRFITSRNAADNNNIGLIAADTSNNVVIGPSSINVLQPTHVVFSQSGNIGIGTTSPQKKLEVVGDLNVTGTIYGALNTTGDVNCTGCVDTADIANSAVTTAKIANGAVTSSKLANPLGGSINATAYYDSDSGNYVLDMASTGTALSLAGNIVLNNNKFLYGKNSVGSDSLLIGRNSSDTLQIGDRLFNNPLVITNGNNFMALETNGVERTRIDSNGNVGVGTTEPNKVGNLAGLAGVNLKISSTSNQARLTVEGSASGDLVLVDGNGRTNFRAVPFVVDYDSLNIGNLDETAGTTTSRLFINMSTGNVGVGTTKPNNTFTVLASSALSVDTDSGEIVRLQNSGSTTNAARISIIAGNAGESAVRFGDTDSRAVGAIYYDHSTNNMSFYVNGDQRMVIGSGGNVGIGTSSPSYNLEVVGGAADTTVLLVKDAGGNRIDVGTSVDIRAYPSTGSQVSISGMDSGGSFHNMISVINNQIASSPVVALGHVTGRIGVGTTTPTTLLHVVSGNTDGVTVQAPSRPLIKINSTASTINQAWLVEITNEGDTAGDLAIREDSVVGSVRLVIQNTTGNVGIGALNPSARLEVNGGVRLNTTTSKPTCSATQRGTIWFEQASDDLLYTCMKNNTNHYNWVLVARGS